MSDWRANVWWRRLALLAVALLALAHAARYDFFCDDAFIALRYAKNLSQHGQLVYNLGERVEGFTSPLWVLLVALGGLLGAPLVSAAHVLGGLACVGTFGAMALLGDELFPDRPWLVIAPAVALAVCAPFAAWTFGGLETPLFACMYTLSLAFLARAARERELRAIALAGVNTALCTLCRPEGALLIALGTLLLLVHRPIRASRARGFLAWAMPSVVLVAGYELFRLFYYGYPLPNTFYVKTSGEGLWQRGVGYLQLAGSEFGWPLVVCAALSVGLLLSPGPVRRAFGGSGAKLSLVALIAAAAALQLAYVARVGGDFLDLYRFLVPLLPGMLCVFAAGVTASYRALASGPLRWAVVLCGVCLFAAHVSSQRAMAMEALRISAESRRALRLEPLGWTRVYGKRWSGIGRWLAAAKLPTDSTAIGAAGAVPFFSELPNLDLFGLNDVEIARHGRVIGNRPGHQRFTTMEYLLAKRPTFVFMAPESTPSRSTPLKYDRFWIGNGYVPIEIRVDASLCECGETFYQQLFVARERAESLRGLRDVVVGRAQALRF